MDQNVQKIISPELMILIMLYKGYKTIHDLAIKLPWSVGTIYYNIRKLQAHQLIIGDNGKYEITEKGRKIIEEITSLLCD